MYDKLGVPLSMTWEVYGDNRAGAGGPATAAGIGRGPCCCCCRRYCCCRCCCCVAVPVDSSLAARSAWRGGLLPAPPFAGADVLAVLPPSAAVCFVFLAPPAVQPLRTASACLTLLPRNPMMKPWSRGLPPSSPCSPCCRSIRRCRASCTCRRQRCQQTVATAVQGRWGGVGARGLATPSSSSSSSHCSKSGQAAQPPEKQQALTRPARFPRAPRLGMPAVATVPAQQTRLLRSHQR